MRPWMKACVMSLPRMSSASPRETFDHLMQDRSAIDEELRKGADKARTVAGGVLSRVRNKLGYARS
jgi:hypothetical protein